MSDFERFLFGVIAGCAIGSTYYLMCIRAALDELVERRRQR